MSGQRRHGQHREEEEEHQSDTTVNEDAPGLCWQVMGVVRDWSDIFGQTNLDVNAVFQHFLSFLLLLDLTGSDFVSKKQNKMEK